MYEEAILKQVAKNIPVYRKLDADVPDVRPPFESGHFGCRNCGVGPLSATRTYVTTVVTNLEEGPDEHLVAFVWSPDDTAYRTARTLIAGRLRDALGIGDAWAYFTPDDIANDPRVYVRMTWDFQRRQWNHINANVNMADLIGEIDVEVNDDGEAWMPDIGMSLIRPPVMGTYYNPVTPDVRRLWGTRHYAENTFTAYPNRSEHLWERIAPGGRRDPWERIMP